MSEFSVSSRYASALMQVAEEKNSVDSVSKDMELVFNTLDSSKELRSVLKSPIIKEQQKIEVLSDIFAEKVSSVSFNFIKFVVDKNRDYMLYAITKNYLKLRDEKLGLIKAIVTSAVNFSDEQIVKLKTKIEEITGKKASLSFKIDESVIGGFAVKIDDTVFDASVKRQLEILKHKFLTEN